MNFVSIDFETANEQRNSACSLGIAIVENGCVSQSQSWLIKPAEQRFSAQCSAIHGITYEHVESAPTLPEVWPIVETKLQGMLVVAHNAAFDMSVMRHSFFANGMAFPVLKYLCSCKLAKQVWSSLASHRLSFLTSYHGIDLVHHDARSDAIAAAELVLLAGREHGSNCPFKLAEQFSVTIGKIAVDGNWTPSSAPRLANKVCIELELPEGFDITQHPLYGKSVVFTGALNHFSRDNAEHLVETVGGFAKSSVSKKTDFLVCGTQDLRVLANGTTDSSKLRNAKTLCESGVPIQIIDEDDFLRILTEPCFNEND